MGGIGISLIMGEAALPEGRVRFWFKPIKSTLGSNPDHPRAVLVNCRNPIVTQAAAHSMRIIGVVAVMMPCSCPSIKSIQAAKHGANPEVAFSVLV